MGLLDKIEDKLSGNKSNKAEEQTTQAHEQNTTGSSSLRHPISSAQTSSPTTSSNIGSAREGNPNVPYDQSEYARGTQPTTHTTQNTSRLAGDGHPTTTTSTNTTSATTSDRQYYDPYSSKGQQTAATAAQDYGMTPSAQQGSRAPYEDADVARSQRGGVLNNNESQTYGQSTRSGVQRTSNTTGAQPSGGHHYGRDAGIVGGTGAAGVGAYEASKHHGATSDSRERYGDQSSTYPTAGNTQPSSTHHYGRDAGIVGGTGVAGVGAYEASKHHDTTSDSRDRYRDQSSTTYPATGNTQPSSTHHYGRDAGVVGGAGAAGVGAYELNKHHDANRDRYVDQSAGFTTTGGTGAQQAYPSAGIASSQQQYSEPSRRSAEGAGVSSTGDESAGGLTTAKKVAAAYEAGYKDGMEHMKAEMTQKFASQQL